MLPEQEARRGRRRKRKEDQESGMAVSQVKLIPQGFSVCPS